MRGRPKGPGRTVEELRDAHLKALQERNAKREDRKKEVARKARNKWFRAYSRKRKIKQREEVAELLNTIKQKLASGEW